MSVIDLHSHIVPAVDDGAATHREAISMLDKMSSRLEPGSTIVFTPHYSCMMHRRVVTARHRKSIQFQDRMEEKYPDGPAFLSAGELMIRGRLLKYFEEVRYPGTGWVLVEFNTRVTWIETLIQLRRIIRQGYSPLLAHPERYRWCRINRDRLIKLSRMGCGTMVSARSLHFEKYAATARNLLRDGFSHALCSDAHSPHDSILDGKLRKKVEESSTIPWKVFTSEMPGMILSDTKLPELPLIAQRKSR